MNSILSSLPTKIHFTTSSSSPYLFKRYKFHTISIPFPLFHPFPQTHNANVVQTVSNPACLFIGMHS